MVWPAMRRRLPNAQYNVTSPESLATKLASFQRRKMYRAFLAMEPSASDTILDLGVTSDQSYDHSNYLEAWYPHKHRITAAGIDAKAAFLEERYPGVRFVCADGRNLQFADNSFDYVHSSAVLEHVGSRSQQMTFIAETRRVARKGVFLTTPNRWFPVEFHTVMPLIHWLPPRAFRRLLVAIGHDFFAQEANLNLLSSHELRGMANELGFSETYEVNAVHLLGVPSNLLFVLRKR